MYQVDDTAVANSVAALPPHLLEPYLELRAALEVAPDDVGSPLVADRPEGMRSEAIGPDREMIVFFGKWADPQRVVVVYEIVSDRDRSPEDSPSRSYLSLASAA